jgi:ketosteroid isomerase-like protein
MKHLMPGLTRLFTGLGMVSSGHLAGGEDDKAAVTRVLSDYYRAFSSAVAKLDVQTILPYYHESSLLMGSQGLAAMPTHAALAAMFTTAMEGLRARGYARSELSGLKLKRLSATCMLASGIATRYKADGEELDRIGVTYLLHKADSGWKIAVLVTHDAENDLQLE